MSVRARLTRSENNGDSRSAMHAEDVVPEEQASISSTNVGTGEALNVDRMREQIIISVNAEDRVRALLDELADYGSPRTG